MGVGRCERAPTRSPTLALGTSQKAVSCSWWAASLSSGADAGVVSSGLGALTATDASGSRGHPSRRPSSVEVAARWADSRSTDGLLDTGGRGSARPCQPSSDADPVTRAVAAAHAASAGHLRGGVCPAVASLATLDAVSASAGVSWPWNVPARCAPRSSSDHVMVFILLVARPAAHVAAKSWASHRQHSSRCRGACVMATSAHAVELRCLPMVSTIGTTRVSRLGVAGSLPD